MVDSEWLVSKETVMIVPWGFLKRVLAGAIFGLYMAHLLYYLNPQIDITPLRLAVVTLAYGIICGLIFGTILWILRMARVRLLGKRGVSEEQRHGFGFIVAAAFVSAAVYWLHLVLFRIYLPIGAVRILSKATNVIVVTAFCLFVLWLVERSAGRNLSRPIFLLGCTLIAVSSFFLYQRRDRYRTDVKTVVVADVGTLARRPLILVTIRSLPYDWMLTLVGEGSVPWFERAAEESFATRLEPFRTTSSKALWASLATGQLPHRHGVTGRFSYRTPLNRPGERFLLIPSAVGFRAWGLIPPIRRISAQLPAGDSIPFWRIFERIGLNTVVVNWPLVAVATPLSPRLSAGGGGDRGVYPPGLIAIAVNLLRTAPPPTSRVAAGIRSAPEPVRERIKTAIEDDLAVTTLAGGLVTAVRPDLLVLSYAGLAQVEQTLSSGNTLPPRSSVSGQLLRTQVQQLDTLLRELEQVIPGAIMIVTSVSGARPPSIPTSPMALIEALLESEDPGKDDGFLLVRGPGIVHQENPLPARVVDVVPTTLFAAGLPVARDMDGRVVTEAFAESFLRENTLSLVQSYEAERLIVRTAPTP